jgi:hypothetical protein
LGITNYDAKQDLVQWLRCYALSIENAGGNNDINCLSAWTKNHSPSYALLPGPRTTHLARVARQELD